MSRPPEMWSTVRAMSASRFGLRYELHDHERAEMDALRGLRHRGEQAPALEVRAVGVAEQREEVIPGEERVGARLLGAEPGVAHLLERAVLGRDADADAERAVRHPIPSSRSTTMRQLTRTSAGWAHGYRVLADVLLRQEVDRVARGRAFLELDATAQLDVAERVRRIHDGQRHARIAAHDPFLQPARDDVEHRRLAVARDPHGCHLCAPVLAHDSEHSERLGVQEGLRLGAQRHRPDSSPGAPASRKRSRSAGISPARAPASERVEGHTAHDRGRHATERADDELRGRGDLVGHVQLGALQHAPGVVALARVDAHRGEAGAAHRDARRAEAERAAERVGDDHRDVGRGEGVAQHGAPRRRDRAAAGWRRLPRRRSSGRRRPRRTRSRDGSRRSGTRRGAGRSARSRRGSARSCADRPRRPRSRLLAATASRSPARRSGPRPSRRPSAPRTRCRRRAGRPRSAPRRPRAEPPRSSPGPSSGSPRRPMTATSLTARARRGRARRRPRGRASASGRRSRAGRARARRPARLSSALSSTNPEASGASTPATPTAETSCPSVSSIPASGPLTAWDPIIGVIATTSSRRASTASRTPSTARIGSSETNGLEGASTIRSASAIASSTPGAGRAPGTPSKRTALTGSAARRPTSHSWNASSPPRVTMRVRRRSSLAGSRRAPSP